jgi:hypothetical protein
MGANSFWAEATGRTADEAFRCAVEQARYEYGHRGYTGSIAEKHEFALLRVSKAELLRWLDQEIRQIRAQKREYVGFDQERVVAGLMAKRATVASGGEPTPVEFAQIVSNLFNGPGSDKWGPAAAVQLSLMPGDSPGCKRFAFFGLASS